MAKKQRTDITMAKQRTDITMAKQKTDITMAKQKKQDSSTTMIYTTLHRKLKIKQHEPHKIPGINSGAVSGEFKFSEKHC